MVPSSTRDLEALLPPIATKLMAADRLETPQDSRMVKSFKKQNRSKFRVKMSELGINFFIKLEI